MAVVEQKRVIWYFIPADNGKMMHVCDFCLVDLEGQTEGRVPNYGDEECNVCGYETGGEKDDEEDKE